MKKILMLASIATTFGIADFIGGEIDLGYYSHSPSGTAQYKGDSVDIEKDLNWADEKDMFIRAYFEHPVPIIPNIRVGYSKFSHEGDGTASKQFSWNNFSIDLTDKVYSKIDLDMYDLTLYYEFLDNWLSADAGLNVKYLDGTVDVRTTTDSSHNDVQVPIPMLYLKGRVDIPATDLSFQLEGDYISYSGNMLYDFELGARYTFFAGLGLEAGYKAMKIKIDDIDDFSMDTDFNGAYGKIVWDF
ncbi:MAG: TIGR04219 family outer membrane beta-barrel protein [Sulfurovaceae bacterium]|nr:TIGR04219 family outer membrane beta-barrel protein [Sulfurovaceae bacterium]